MVKIASKTHSAMSTNAMAALAESFGKQNL